MAGAPGERLLHGGVRGGETGKGGEGEINGERGRWGEREMGREGDGEMGRGEDEETGR